jgi:hypothetical protein
MEFGDVTMNDTFTVPTQEELDEYLRRGHVARSEAIAEMVLWLRTKLTRPPQAPANPPVDATYA